MIMSKCPGQDTRYWKLEDIQEVKCPGCGESMEFWKTDIRVRCRNCQRVVSNPNFNLECAAWCSFATQCLGDVARGLGQPKSLRKKLEKEMERDIPEDTAEIISEALEKGWKIAEREGAEFLITVLAITYKIIKDHVGKGEGERIFQNIRKRAEIPRLAAEEAIQVAEEVEKKAFGSSSARVVYEALYGERVEVEEDMKQEGNKVKREIIKIDEELCDGCGECVPACAEGAIQIVDGKARLVSEIYCDGLGDCLGECPRGAISMEEREAEPFDEEAVGKHLEAMKEDHEEGCPHCVNQEISREPKEPDVDNDSEEVFSELVNWPVKLKLVSPEADFLNKPEIVISADCVPFAFGNFHRRLLKGRPLLIGCPKLDDTSLYYTKLTEMFKNNTYEKVIVLNMEIPCCSGLYGLVQKALEEAHSKADLQLIRIGISGEVKEES